ncbi:MAG: hypothetical protein ACYTEI_09635 [Planctomycetota bacterium]|jgi:hypothetical protein
MKLVLKLVLVFVVLLVVVVVAIAFYLDAIARGAIETGATYALGVRTTLDEADIGVLSGEFTMKGLDVANPEGFQSDHFLQLGEGYVDVSLGSLRQETVELPTLTLTTVNMTLEKKGGESNYKVILDNLKRFESGEGQDKKMAGKKFNIQEAVISDINVEIDLFGVGGEVNRARVPIDEIRLTNVGAGGGDTAEITDVIIKAIMAAIMAKAADLPAELVNDLGGQLKGLESLADMGIDQSFDFGKQMGDAAGKAVDDATKGLGEEADKAVKGLGGLLGGDKK